MDAAVSAGWIGLVGTTVGAGGALLGGWMQQRHQVKTAREERRHVLAITAAEAALAELFEMQREVRICIEPPSEGESTEQIRRIHGWQTKINLLMQRVPDADVRQRVCEAVALSYLFPRGTPHISSSEWQIYAMCMSSDAVECLGAYLREEPLPPRPEKVAEARHRLIEDVGRITNWFISSR